MKSNCGIYEIFVLYIFSIYYVVKEFFSRLILKTGLSGKLLLKCDGRTAVITGGTSGIGLETAKKLLSYGMNVIIGAHIPDNEKLQCLNDLKRINPKSMVDIWHLDLVSMESVKLFANRYLESDMPLHILINNAGVMFVPYKLTENDFESHLAINYLSHCLLTKLLLPRLQMSGKPKCHSRIINTSSCLHYLSTINFEDLHSKLSYCPHQGYMQSKLAQVMFTQSLDRFLKAGGCQITTVSLHPGVIYSPLYRHVWWAPYFGPIFLKRDSSIIIASSPQNSRMKVGCPHRKDSC